MPLLALQLQQRVMMRLQIVQTSLKRVELVASFTEKGTQTSLGRELTSLSPCRLFLQMPISALSEHLFPPVLVCLSFPSPHTGEWEEAG